MHVDAVVSTLVKELSYHWVGFCFFLFLATYALGLYRTHQTLKSTSPRTVFLFPFSGGLRSAAFQLLAWVGVTGESTAPVVVVGVCEVD